MARNCTQPFWWFACVFYLQCLMSRNNKGIVEAFRTHTTPKLISVPLKEKMGHRLMSASSSTTALFSSSSSNTLNPDDDSTAQLNVRTTKIDSNNQQKSEPPSTLTESMKKFLKGNWLVIGEVMVILIANRWPQGDRCDQNSLFPNVESLLFSLSMDWRYLFSHHQKKYKRPPKRIP